MTFSAYESSIKEISVYNFLLEIRASGFTIINLWLICTVKKFCNLILIVSSANYSLFYSDRIELGTILNFNKEVESYMVEASDWKSDMLR